MQLTTAKDCPAAKQNGPASAKGRSNHNQNAGCKEGAPQIHPVILLRLEVSIGRGNEGLRIIDSQARHACKNCVWSGPGLGSIASCGLDAYFAGWAHPARRELRISPSRQHRSRSKRRNSTFQSTRTGAAGRLS